MAEPPSASHTVIRAFEDGDRAAAADLIAAEWPHRADEAAPLRQGDYLPGAHRWTAADPKDGAVRAYASLWRVVGDRFRMDLVVAPEWRRQGIGSRMMEMLVDTAAASGAATLQARACATAADALRFLERRGFAGTMRMQGMRLDPRSVDVDRLASFERRAAEQGFAITTLADARRDPECWRKLWRLYTDVQEGWADPDPRPGPAQPMSFEAFLARVAELPPDAEAFFILVKDGRYAGFTGSLGTGVHPELRGLGLANALKARAALHARAAGVDEVEISTGNAAMQRANENVGFRLTYCEVRLVRPLPPAR